MRFSIIFTVIAAGAMALAGAVPEVVEKRSITDIKNSITALGEDCTPVINKFDTCYDDDCTLEICLEIAALIDGCTTDIDGLSGGFATLDLATVIAGVFAQISVALENHKNNCGTGCPQILTAYAHVDVSLHAFLSLCISVCLGLTIYLIPLVASLVLILNGIGILPLACGLL